jgi:hypothetical protein
MLPTCFGGECFFGKDIGLCTNKLSPQELGDKRIFYEWFSNLNSNKKLEMKKIIKRIAVDDDLTMLPLSRLILYGR